MCLIFAPSLYLKGYFLSSISTYITVMLLKKITEYSFPVQLICITNALQFHTMTSVVSK